MRFVIAAALLLAACNEMPHQKAAAPASPPEPAPAATPAPTDAWIGEWPGVEGTFLKIDAGAAPGAYTLTQGTLDGVNTYQGTADGEVIAFERNGARETVRKGTGQETGLKWLLEKTDCLVIKEGEGYCK